MATAKHTRAGKAQSRPIEAQAPGVERIRRFEASSLGLALGDAEEALTAGIALTHVVCRSLDADDGNEREVDALNIALERLEASRELLDSGRTQAARVSQCARPIKGTVVCCTDGEVFIPQEARS